MIDLGQLQQIMPHAGAAYIPHLPDAMREYDINTPARAAAFLAQLAVESGELQFLEENLRYHAAGLMKTWPHRFDAQTAFLYVLQPERIANRAYANRNGNGNEASGDGWRFRGRGLIQITGRANYAACSAALFGDARLLDSPDLLASIVPACRSAAWWWHAHGCNALAATGNFEAITRCINGGLNGQTERLAYWARAKHVLGVKP